MITLIASVGENNELGRDGDLCWYIREDLRRFKALTMGNAVIMGRKTWESLPKKPLPGRLNIVLSKKQDPTPAPSPLWEGSGNGEAAVTNFPSHMGEGPGVGFAASVDQALEMAGEREVFIIGGESVYRTFLPLADRLELTRIFASDPQADKFFPEFTLPVSRDTACRVAPQPDVTLQPAWRLAEASNTLTSESGLRFRYETWERV